ncbi:hypothetical protein FA15DRAFT_674980 [Coprinopsis marcescibilis]|uniref:Ras-associating domain-containing protein n=1 Tax=Coprinopsis marcescibilis TaxID=230819 RepID=A0A5C3KG81_COPMA|nr:hypothetical protein FA15DRAFT_674980 [Coprinopsis marcescibilis]
MPSASHNPLPLVRIVATWNGEEYAIVDLTGTCAGSKIRDQILYKLQVPLESRADYFIYLSEIGSLAIGTPLNDEQLYYVCAERGDPSGSLKFFVSKSAYM